VPRRGGPLYGDAIRTAIEEVRGRLTVFMDADGSHTPEFLPELVAGAKRAEVVIASRYVAGGYTENPWVLIAMSRILNWTYSLVLGLRCKDVSNSFKLYRTDWLKELVLVCDNFDIIEEILFKLSRKHRDIRILEVPFSFKKRMFGQTKRNLVLFILGYLVTMVKLRFSTVGEKLRRLKSRPSIPRRNSDTGL
jgi:dolichol-phosphate mannosyltransferase